MNTFEVMKKLLLLSIQFLFAFQCEPEAIEKTPILIKCPCFNEIVYINDGVDTILIERQLMPDYKCEMWGLGLEYQRIPESVYVSRMIEICE